MEDAILIHGLELRARIGVPDDERATPQRLTLNARLVPQRDFRALDDNLANTIDYAAVCDAIRSLSTPRHLLETLACDIAAHLLAHFPLRSIDLELRKYILPATDYVAVCIRRERDHPL